MSGLLQLLLAQLGTLHIHEQHFLTVFDNDVVNVEGCCIGVTGRTANSEFGIQRRGTLWDLYFLGTVSAEAVVALELHHRQSLPPTVQTYCTHYYIYG